MIILWVGAQDVLSGTISPGRLSQFVLFAVFAASGLGQLSEVWGELSQAAGSAERLAELLAIEPEIRAPAHPVPVPSQPRAEIAFEAVRFAYPTRPDSDVLDGVSFNVQPGDKLYSPATGAQSCGTIVSAAPGPDGVFDALAVMQIAAAEHREIHLRSPDGPELELEPLPYKVTTD